MFTQQMMSMMGDDDMRALMQDVERQNQQQGGAGTATVQALPDPNTPAETESTAESAAVESQPNPETMPQRQVTRRQFAFQDTDFDLSAASGERFDDLNVLVPDAHAGVYYQFVEPKRFRLHGGAAFFHLLNPNESLICLLYTSDAADE